MERKRRLYFQVKYTLNSEKGSGAVTDMMDTNKLIVDAYKVLHDKPIERELVDGLAALEGPDILDLISLANKVRAKFVPEMHACTIMNAKSGHCSQDCRFCAQSAHHETSVEVYPLSSKEEILEKAQLAHEAGVKSFGIVTSGFGYKTVDDDFRNILESIDTIHERMPEMHVCASLGILSEETATALAAHNIRHYNINIQTNPSRYEELVSSTHDIQERIETIKLLKNLGVGVCCGGILGLGENMLDRMEMAFALKDLDVDVIPLNVLIPVEGTRAESTKAISAAEIAKTFALFRLIHPKKTLKFAAGRETRMKDFQGLLMLAGANGMLTGGYLTTRGRSEAEDQAFIEDLNSFVVSS
jgi:biotin synthase